MYLITIDIINSKTSNVRLEDCFTEEQLIELCSSYDLNRNDLWFHDGDQISIGCQESGSVIELSLNLLLILHQHGLLGRVYIIKEKDILSSNLALNTELRKRQIKLEVYSKNKYKQEFNSIYYHGYSKTNEINLLLVSLSKLCLSKVNYLPALYMTVYQGKKQAEIAEHVDLSQAAIVNQLRKANARLLVDFETEITKLLENDL